MPARKHYTKPGSLAYKEAGSRQRLMLDRLREARWEGEPFPPVAWKIALAVSALTASWSKAWDETYVAAIAGLAGCDRTTASKWLPRMAEAGVLQWRPSKWNRAPSLVGLPLADAPDDMSPHGDMWPHDNMSSSQHVAVGLRNGSRATTLPKVTAADPASRPSASRRRKAPRCGYCGGGTTVADGVASCDSGCHWSVPV